MASQFDSSITYYARTLFNNKKLRVKDTQEWSTRPIAERNDEATAFIQELGVYVAIPKALDKRAA